MKRWVALVTVGMLFWSCASPAMANERRSKALQLYQEGLFQETGTGNLSMAIKIYTKITRKYKIFRDIAAVAYYHLGLVHEKLGQLKMAKNQFVFIAKHFKDQKKLAVQSDHKIQQLALKLKTRQHLKKQTSEPTSRVTPEPEPFTPPPPVETCLPATRIPEALPLFGIGINMAGLQLRYRTIKNMQIEFKSQTRNNDFFFGTRCSVYSEHLADTIPIACYAGVEHDWVFDNMVNMKYLVGGFVGGEWTVAENIGLGADAGYYYENVQMDSTITIRTRVLSNVYITFYF